MLNRIKQSGLLIAVLLFGFYLTISLLSHTFDGDLGWHLRFGQDAVKEQFQYKDSYTWGYEGQQWVNHSWGGDIVFHLLSNQFGYFSLVVFISLFIWSAFVLAPLVIKNKKDDKLISTASIIISIFLLLAVKFLLVMRLAMVTPLFFIIIIYSLEHLNDKKTYRLWPIIFWLWSALHGSWVLGFVVINIYLFFSNSRYSFPSHLKRNEGILNQVIKFFQEILHCTQDDKNNLMIKKKILIWQTISAFAITLNPYGWKIWQEVLLYFTNNFYKLHITEWLPSYSYPVFWAPLVIACFCAVMLYLAHKEKQLKLVHLILFIVFFIAAFKYKRHNIFLVIICAPIIYSSWIYLQTKLKILNNKLILTTIILFIISTIIITQKPIIRYNNNIFSDQQLLQWYGFPVKSMQILKQKIADNNEVKIFNEYSWGGYLTYSIPNCKIFLDGRSAATWKDNDGKLMLAKQLDILSQPDGLKYLEYNQVEYIILRKNISGYSQPNFINKIVFGKKLDELFVQDELQLINDINANPNWQLIADTQLSWLWQFNFTSTTE